ncbi:MAG: FAD:protein FMN transferase [Gemmatimonadales bacterium]
MATAAMILKLHPLPAIAQGPRQEYRQLHLGVEVRLVVATADRAGADAAARAAYAAIAELEQTFSDWRPTSEARRLGAHHGEWVTVSEPLLQLTTRALAVARASHGAFDPTVGPLVAVWREARGSGVLPTESAIARARHAVGWRRVHVDRTRGAIKLDAEGMRLDFGGIAKGYILDSARQVLQQHGFASVMLDAGGDIVLGDSPPGEAGWRVAVATARGDTTLVLARVAVGTSGPGEQHLDVGGVRYSHVIDPRTGRALTSPTQATVIHPLGMMSDALSTMITVLGAEHGSRVAKGLGAVAIFVSNPPAP